MLTTQFKNIHFIGDVHGSFDVLTNIITTTITQNTLFIQIGDFELGFRHIALDKDDLRSISQTLTKHKAQMWVIRGNHDNPEFWETTNELLPNIWLIQDHTRHIINKKSYYFVGGGISIDRYNRLPKQNYWTNETLPIPPQHIPQSDILVIHVYPINIPGLKLTNIQNFYHLDPNLKTELETEQNNIQTYIQKTNPKWVIGGHLHLSIQKNWKNRKWKCLDILEIWKP